MKLAILGPAFSGKTTVFNALTGAEEALSDFSGSGTSHQRDVAVPDARLDRVAADHSTKKITPARVEFLDLPAYGGSEKFFADARQNQALIIVVRAFESGLVPHPNSKIDWKSDLEGIQTDFVLQDLAMIERRIERIEATIKKSKNKKEDMEELELLKRVQPGLEEGVPLKKSLAPDEQEVFRNFAFLTLKPTLTLVNIGDDDDPTALGVPAFDEAAVSGNDDAVIPIRARLEAEVAQLDEEDRAEFLTDFGLSEPIREVLIRLSYALLGQISFLTGTGPKEARAWTIPRGSSAVDAARQIHSDIARGFIRAEVVGWSDYETHGGWKGARNAKSCRLEGRDYVVQDGDLIEFRHGG